MEETCPESTNSIKLGIAQPPTTATKTILSVAKQQSPLQSDSLSLNEQPSTSSGLNTASMSLLQEGFVDSQHDFAEVLDDETTTSGVLETFEISSSNSLPPSCSDVHREVVVDDSSSTDTIKLVEVSNSTSCNNKFFNVSEVYVINDDDDDDDVPEVEEGEVEDEDLASVNETAMHPHSVQDSDNQHQLSRFSSNSTNSQLGSVIVTNGGATIYLETPVVEEQHQHHLQLSEGGENGEFGEKAGKPKRLSDEFMLTDEAEPFGKVSENKSRNTDGETSATTTFEGVGSNELLPDRVSFRLKEMNINNSAGTKICKNNPCNNSDNSADRPSSSKSNENEVVLLPAPSMADIESMDLIERRDFETEQRLTDGLILKGSSLINNNMINLRLINASWNTETHRGKLELEDDCPSSSSNINNSSHSNFVGRAVSSDSKCAYKDLASTPTSSRNYNSRLTKSTAKLNLCSTLSHPQHRQVQPLQDRAISANNSTKIYIKSQQPGNSNNKSLISLSSSSHTCTSISSASTSVSSSSASSASSSTSSVIVEARNATSVSSSSLPGTPACTIGGSGVGGGGAAAEIYSNSNSNDSLMSSASTTTNCRHRQQQQPPNGLVDRSEVGGCSRTSSIHAAVAEAENNAVAAAAASSRSAPASVFDDAQPSTSSARCQYAPSVKSLRQVHASAQTHERYIGRGGIATVGISGPAVSGSGINFQLASSRSRRRADLAAQLNRNNTSEEVITAAFKVMAEAAAAAAVADYNDESSWADCDENTSDEEICTCHHSSSSSASNSSHGGSNTSLNETDTDAAEISFGGGTVSCAAKDGDLSNYIQMVSISEEVGGNGTANSTTENTPNCAYFNAQQRKRKYNDNRLLGADSGAAVSSNGSGSNMDDVNCRKRIAYDFTSTTRHNSALVALPSTPTTQIAQLTTISNSSMGRRTPRSIIPTRENPPPELQHWLSQFQRWTHVERLMAIDRLIEHCEPTQVRHMMKVIEPQFQRDFISLLPRELALQVLAYLEPKDLLRAAQTCRSWRFLCDDNLLWKEKCRKAQILTEPRTDRPKRGRAGNMPPIASPWKAAYMRQHIIEMNWRSRPIREPKVLKGHDDHVITCLQFSGNRIVSGSDDNTLKVWSAVTGRCLRTLVGHTGGVWSSQMSGNIIISGSTDRTLKVWDMDTGQCLHTLLGHTSTVRCMHLHGNKVVSGSRDATLRVWDIEQGSCLHVLVGHLAAVRCVQYDGKLIVSGAYDYMVKIWHPERQECLHTLSGHTNRVYSLQFDGMHVVSGSLDTSIRVWDVETGNCKHTLMGHQSLTSGMELRQNILVSGNADSTVKVWDITTGQCLQTLSGPNKHQSAVTCLQFNSRFVVTSSDDGTVKLWDVKTGEFIRNLVALDSGGSGGVVWRIRANDTKLICAVGSRNGTEETKLMVLDFDVEGACVKCS
ncbi:PREDICTED: F-box/WD repeat-containing protein 7 isoform X1 [Rhagoletis zephyria]|uniref:F-box/WD repeat-containing protein 7 isoform X1 n=1 Tax=Rhagoletis zephyria TaxID=28612 RepID=UPI0008114FE7|nr:PREDICTED: F-box/WD repeat-containing protein 7 isoform X1 [Rhagoletis zephyria]